MLGQTVVKLISALCVNARGLGLGQIDLWVLISCMLSELAMEDGVLCVNLPARLDLFFY